MANKVGEDFYRKLSRKELQSLCKKCGLPARKSSYEMAESLRSYFLRRDLSVSALGKSFNKIQEAPPPTSLPQLLQPVAPLNLTEKVTVADGFVPRLYTREEHGKGSVNTTCDEIQSCVGYEACCQVQENNGCINDSFRPASQSQFHPQYAGWGFDPFGQPGRVDQEDSSQVHCNHINVAANPRERAFSMKTSSQAPATFEFHVSSEGGINLCVDLNSSPSDWINKYRNQVYLCENVSDSKSQNFHQELGRIGDNNKHIKRPFVQGVRPGEITDCHPTEPSPSSIMGNNHGLIDDTGGASQGLMPLPMVSCNVNGDVSECFAENHHLNSSTPYSDLQNHAISNTQSRNQNGYAATVHSAITDVPLENTACNFATNYISNGSANLVALEHQRSKHNDEVYDNSTLQNGYSLENSSVGYPGYLASHSTVAQLLEAKNYHKTSSEKPDRNCEFLDLVYSKTTEGSETEALVNTRENDPCGKYLQACSDEQDWINIGNGRESSVCSHLENSYEKACSVPGSVQLDPDLHRKRLQMDECQHCSSVRGSKFFKSTNQSAGEVFPRRSTRLVSKVHLDAFLCKWTPL